MEQAEITTRLALMERVAYCYGALGDKARRVADYLEAHPSSVALDDIQTIATRCGVKPSTVVRFAQKLGLSGFLDVARLFRADFRQLLDPAAPMQAAGGHRALGALEEAIRQLELIRYKLHPDQIEMAAKTIRRAEMVWIHGSRRAAGLLERAAVLLRQQARPHVLAASLDLGPTGGAQADEVVFAIAIGADRGELDELPEIVRKRRCQLVALGDFAQSSLLRSANCPVLVPRAGSETHHLIVTLTILDAILGDLPRFPRIAQQL